VRRLVGVLEALDRSADAVIGDWIVFWEVALIVLLFIGVGGVLAVPALADIRATVDKDR